MLHAPAWAERRAARAAEKGRQAAAGAGQAAENFLAAGHLEHQAAGHHSTMHHSEKLTALSLEEDF
jgi:hypothetical protein